MKTKSIILKIPENPIKTIAPGFVYELIGFMLLFASFENVFQTY